jgi:hypothetical protein
MKADWSWMRTEGNVQPQRSLVERWTIKESLGGRYQPHIQFGGRAFWCMFDYVVGPEPESDKVEIVLADGADLVSVSWFPHLKQGMEQGLSEAEQNGRRLAGVHITIQKIYEHPIDTTAYGCKRYGQSFVRDVVCYHAVIAE